MSGLLIFCLVGLGVCLLIAILYWYGPAAGPTGFVDHFNRLEGDPESEVLVRRIRRCSGFPLLNAYLISFQYRGKEYIVKAEEPYGYLFTHNHPSTRRVNAEVGSIAEEIVYRLLGGELKPK